MKGVIIAWGVAEAIVIYRAAKDKRPPYPGEMLGASGAFVVLAILAEGAPALAATVAVGIDVAALFQVWPFGGGTAGTNSPDLASAPYIRPSQRQN